MTGFLCFFRILNSGPLLERGMDGPGTVIGIGIYTMPFCHFTAQNQVFNNEYMDYRISHRAGAQRIVGTAFNVPAGKGGILSRVMKETARKTRPVETDCEFYAPLS